MKRIIITSNGFFGQVYAVYGDDLMLRSLEMTAAQLTPAQVEWLKENIPTLLYAEMAEHLATKRLHCVIEGYEVSFDQFWDAYDEKINVGRCKPVWNKLTAGEKAQAYMGILAYNRHLAEQPWKTKANPENYLKQKYWNNKWK